MIAYQIENADYNCKYRESWIQLWDDIESITKSVINHQKKFLMLFQTWYKPENLQCSLDALQDLQRLRLDLLKFKINN